MLRSLVGSEMCIRDRPHSSPMEGQHTPTINQLILSMDLAVIQLKYSHLILHISQQLSPSVVAFMETKVKEHSLREYSLAFLKGWGFCNNYSHSYGGRIWVCWNKEIWKCGEIAKSGQHITLTMDNKGGFSGVVSFVYGETGKAAETFYGLS